MRAVDIIVKKREKQELTGEEIQFFVEGFTKGEIPDYQASAWAMAVLLNGMTAVEVADLTLAMAASGEYLDLSKVVPIAVDKHSTGGVGDKTTLVVEPIVAASGLAIGKMSGRGLGFSGGTIDKMESIPGFRANLTKDEFLKQLKDIGLVLTGQSQMLAPADGKLYALRDVTGTVPSIPLIASSVMSKKIAAGAQVVVLDVKVGLGAFMKTLDEAKRLAELMVEIARLAKRRAVALLSDMNQPLGNAVGNVLEVREAIDTLKGGGPQDFREHCLVVAGHMLALGGISQDECDGRKMAEQKIRDGSAFEAFRKLVIAQGGKVSYVDNPQLLKQATLIQTVLSPRSGYLSQIHAQIIGEAGVRLGAGREKKGDAIDHAVGVIVYHKVGDCVHKGQPLAEIHANDPVRMEAAIQAVQKAHQWSEEPVKPLPLFYGLIK